MKGLFNGTCCHCKQFKPHCAAVIKRLDGLPHRYGLFAVTMCEDCRNGEWKGRFRYDARHRG